MLNVGHSWPHRLGNLVMSDAAKQSVPLQNLFRNVMWLIIAAYLVLISYLWRVTLSDVRNELGYTDSMLVHAVRATLSSHELILRELGIELVAQGALKDPERGRELLERMKRLDPSMASLALARPDGQLILASGVANGPHLATLAKQEPTRQSFAETITSTHTRTGRPFFLAGHGVWAVPIMVAIPDARGAVQAVMTADYSLESATTAWSDISLLPRVSVALMGNDGYVRYIHPLPMPANKGTPEEGYATPADQVVQQRISAIRGDHAFLELFLPKAGGTNYLVYTRIPEFGLHAGSFIPRLVVLAMWLDRLAMPTVLMLLFLAGGYIAYKRAVLKQTRADTEIWRLSAWQQAVLDSTDYSIISTDPNGTIVSFNRAAQQMLGYTPDEVVGKVTPAIIHDPDEVEQHANELVAELGRPIILGFETFVAKARLGKAEEREWTYIRKNGSRFPVRLSVTAMHDEQGVIIGAIGCSGGTDSQDEVVSKAGAAAINRFPR